MNIYIFHSENMKQEQQRNRMLSFRRTVGNTGLSVQLKHTLNRYEKIDISTEYYSLAQTSDCHGAL